MRNAGLNNNNYNVSGEEQPKNKMEIEETRGNLIKEFGQIALTGNRFHHKIHLLNII